MNRAVGKFGMFPSIIILASLVLYVGPPTVVAEIRLPALLGDNMVVQQGRPTRLWGWATPGEHVRAAGSWSPQAVSTQATDDGTWHLELPPPPVGGPYTITVTGDNTITLRYVMSGEVWVCSGQSNMEMFLRANGIWHQSVLNAAEEIAAAKHPDIRLFRIPRTLAGKPQTDCAAHWTQCSPQTVEDFSAAAYYFGRRLHTELGVPIGLIQAAWGGTRAEAWTPQPTLRELGGYDEQLDQPLLEPTPENVQRHEAAQQAWNIERYRLDRDNRGYAKGYANIAFDDSAWSAMTLPQAWESAAPDLDIDGVVWFRRAFDLPADWVGKDLTLSLGPIGDCDVTYLNGERIGAVGYETDHYWQTPRRYAVPAGAVRAGRNLLAVRVFDDGGAGGLYGNADQMWLAPVDASVDASVDGLTDAALALAGEWQYKVEAELHRPADILIDANSPSVLYNAMIAPLQRFPIRGVIWYQGENNIGQAAAYRTLFPALIGAWRDAWEQPDMPFYFAQLAPFKGHDPDDEAHLRDIQRQTLATAHTGMAVTADIGDLDDVHPRNKRDVGERLARWALAKTYDRTAIVASGPLYRDQVIEGARIRIRFDYADGGLCAHGATLTGFTIAGADQRFFPARAEIDGDSVTVTNPEVGKPVAVRYGWQREAAGNLFNQAGLPASLFRTDDWPVRARAVEPAAPASIDAVVQVAVHEVLEANFLGVGMQWSAYPWWDVSDADWDKLDNRLAFMRMPLARVMLDTFWYCQGFDAQGAPIYDWQTPFMRKLYRLLDWCQRHDVTVMIGEWGRPNGVDLDLAADDPRWSRIIGDFCDQMIHRRGYTCLKHYNLINEPHGSWTGVTWEEWNTAIAQLHAEFARRGLLDDITLALPDGDRFYTTRCLKQPALPNATGIYDEHWYLYNQEILDGLVELYTREQLRQIRRVDPGKPFILGEIGLIDDKTENDQQFHVFDFWYGASMADAAIQFIRGGGSGLIAWDLDDAMHFCGDGGESMNALSDMLPPDAYARRKVWGMWNILGDEHDAPHEEQIRPWYFTWSALSRAFPPGCQTLAVEPTGIRHLHATAARSAGDDHDGQHLSFAVVNNTDERRRVRIIAPEAPDPITLAQYDYFDADQDNRVDAWPVTRDEQGRDVFPESSRTLHHVNLAAGLDIVLPGRGVVILTSLETGRPVRLERETQRN